VDAALARFDDAPDDAPEGARFLGAMFRANVGAKD